MNRQQHPKRGEPVFIERVHRTSHKHVLDIGSKTARIFFASTVMIVATTGSMVVFILSATALLGIYGWYPQFVAQQWFIYDQLLTIFSFLGLLSGALATTCILLKASSKWAVASAMVCTLSGASVFVVSLIQPLALLWQSLLYYFLPLFMAPLTGTLLTYLQSEDTEASHVPRKSGNGGPEKGPI